MRRFTLRPKPADPREEAIAWLAREGRGDLQTWLDADPEHAALYAAAKAAADAPARWSAHPEMMAMRAAALGSLQARSWRPRVVAAAAAVAIGVLGAGAGASVMWPDTSPTVSRLEQAAAPITPVLNPNAAIYRTAVGERTSATLPDGSVAMLNTDSVIKVAYTGAERGVRLVRGQALFDVAKHKKRPFEVYAGDRRITAVGTTFDVRLDDGRVKVTLVEGVVRVARTGRPAPGPAAPPQAVQMTAGELLEAAPAAPMTVRPADTAAATSWRSGVMVFKAVTLAEAVGEVNRYTRRPLTIADPSIAGYRVTGVFRTGDPDRFARSVAEVLPVEVEAGEGGALTLRSAKISAGG